MEPLKISKDLIVRQSFVISDNLGMGGSLKAGKFYSNEFALTGGFGNDLLELGRFHINRKSDSIYHIYFTEGWSITLALGFRQR